VREIFDAVPGFIGPVGSHVEVVADEALKGLRGLVTGGNEPDIHLRVRAVLIYLQESRMRGPM
jgi:prolyl-tRNA synthetase